MNDVSLDNKWIGQRTLRPDGIEKVFWLRAIRGGLRHARHGLWQGAAEARMPTR